MYCNNRLVKPITYHITSQTQQEEGEDDYEGNDTMVPIKVGTASTVDDCIIVFFFCICIFVICACCCLIDRISHRSNNQMYEKPCTNGML